LIFVSILHKVDLGSEALLARNYHQRLNLNFNNQSSNSRENEFAVLPGSSFYIIASQFTIKYMSADKLREHTNYISLHSLAKPLLSA